MRKIHRQKPILPVKPVSEISASERAQIKPIAKGTTPEGALGILYKNPIADSGGHRQAYKGRSGAEFKERPIIVARAEQTHL